MEKIESMISASYKQAGYRKTDSPSEDILRFENDFSIHFIFLFKSSADLGRDWREAHENLIKDYRQFKGPRYMEWNYYAIFVVHDDSNTDVHFDKTRDEVQSNLAYSRKYVLTADELKELPPGMISEKEMESGDGTFPDALEEWKCGLGENLFDEIVMSPKASVEDRLRKFLENQIIE